MVSLVEVNCGYQSKNLTVKSFELANLNLHQLQQANLKKTPFLLESVVQATGLTNISRYSILFAYPQKETVLDDAVNSAEFIDSFNQDFLAQKPDSSYSNIDLPFKGGWFCYFSYDYAEVVEPVLQLHKSTTPLAIISRIPCAFVVDHEKDLIHLIAEKQFDFKLAEMRSMLENQLNPTKIESIQPLNIMSETQEEVESKYLNGIAEIKEYILSGDIFQVNLSREWQLEVSDLTSTDIYASLRKHNPAPFAANVVFKNFAIISSSPERLVKYASQTGWVETRPIAGTRERSDCLVADQSLVKELISHPKEIAEHIMLIDLERNDLGRICQPGSVEVNELMSVETYQHVHHIVSNVRGKLAEQHKKSPLDIIHAVFPGGTITGCPKIRCMEIIAELEQMPREAYTGSVGYFNLDGSLDTNILIRTFMLKNNKLSFRAGAGIVADSIANKELAEAKQKAKGLINALQV